MDRGYRRTMNISITTDEGQDLANSVHALTPAIAEACKNALQSVVAPVVMRQIADQLPKLGKIQFQGITVTPQLEDHKNGQQG